MPSVDKNGFLRGSPPTDQALGPLLVEQSGTFVIAGEVEVKNDTGRALPITGSRYSGGKSAATAQVTAAGDTTVLTPSAGLALTIYWVSAINDPDAAVSPRIIIKFGSSELYRTYAISHWEPFTGAIDQSLVVNLDQAADVAVTVHYTQA